jgi:hypothetical protein
VTAGRHVFLRLVRIPLAAVSMSLMISACGTPAEVKALSTAQVAYFDTAITAVRVQSEALLLAADTIRQQAESQIDSRVLASRQRSTVALVSLDPEQSEMERRDFVTELLDSSAAVEQSAATSKARLQTTLEAIRTKTQELQLALVQMKDVQAALDAYLQSPQLGERAATRVLGYPGVQNLLNRATEAMSAVSNQSSNLSQLLTQLASLRGTP